MFRHEYKYLINRNDIIILSGRLNHLFRTDVHCGRFGEYTVKSLYFDNFNDIALREKLDGVDRREKFRIRYYNDDLDFIRLEKKSKINGLCLKQSVNITAEECRKIIEGDTAWMRVSRRELVRELYSKMCFELLRPKNTVIYERRAYTYKPGNCRITIDTNLRGSVNVNGFLITDSGYMKYKDNNILEVKWDEFLPGIVRSAVQLNTIGISSFSKYAATRFV